MPITDMDELSILDEWAVDPSQLQVLLAKSKSELAALTTPTSVRVPGTIHHHRPDWPTVRRNGRVFTGERAAVMLDACGINRSAQLI